MAVSLLNSGETLRARSQTFVQSRKIPIIRHWPTDILPKQTLDEHKYKPLKDLFLQIIYLVTPNNLLKNLANFSLPAPRPDVKIIQFGTVYLKHRTAFS